MLWTLAENDIWGFAPQTWVAGGAFVLSIVLPFVGYLVNKARTEADASAAKKAAIDAATDRKQAKGYAEDAAKALATISDKMENANQIAADAKSAAERNAKASERHADIEAAKHETSYKVAPLFLPKGSEATLRLQITNTSLVKPISIDYFAVQAGQGQTRNIGFPPWSEGNRIEASETKELSLPLAAVWEAGAQHDAAREGAKLLIRCTTDGGRYKWIRHLDALWYLRTAAALQRKHEEDTGKDIKLRQPFAGIPRPPIAELGEDTFGDSVCD